MAMRSHVLGTLVAVAAVLAFGGAFALAQSARDHHPRPVAAAARPVGLSVPSAVPVGRVPLPALPPAVPALASGAGIAAAPPVVAQPRRTPPSAPRPRWTPPARNTTPPRATSPPPTVPERPASAPGPSAPAGKDPRTITIIGGD